MPGTDPTARFAELAAGPAEALPLDEAVLLVAAHDHAVDVGAQRGRLDDLAARCDEATLDGVVDLLFAREGFRGDDHDYHHPDNSFLDRVLDRRRGLPILLSILTTEVAHRVGVCVATIGMPGHVLVRDCAEPDRFVDPFGGGRRLDRTGCEAVFAALHPGVAFDPSFLDPIDSRAVLDRVVANLAGSYLARGPRRAAVWALTLRSSLAPGEARRWRDLARAAERAGDWVGAASAWERFGELAAAVPEELQQRIAGLRARMN